MRMVKFGGPAFEELALRQLVMLWIRKEVLSDSKAVARFRRHYEMVKREQRRRSRGQQTKR